MDKEITNKKIEVPKGICLNDKDYIESLLTHLKDMSKNYCVAMSEASNEKLYDMYTSMFKKISKMQRDVYELMFRCGWYPMECVSDTKISSKYNMLTTEYTDLDNN